MSQSPARPALARAWWKEAVVYQIYPSSFKDSNDDGEGDLGGIIEKVDYLAKLGIDAVWLSPVFPSPMADMGYDISDYENIDPRYGTLHDWDRLRDALKRHKIKIIMDLVVNHTSDQHEWFKQSRQSKDNPMRDFYFWRPPRLIDGKKIPPNNWESCFGGSAWQLCEQTGEYYLALFAREQPDLNWDNPEVRARVCQILDFWLARGADGFRMDVITFISKQPGLPDAEIVNKDKFEQPAYHLFSNGPRVHEYIRELHEKVLSKYDTLTVGEAQFTTSEQALEYILPENHEIKEIFSFTLNVLDAQKRPYTLRKWTLPELKKVIADLQIFMYEHGGWNSTFLENHDQARSISRYADDSDEWRIRGAKALALLQTTLSGTLYVYEGQEIGMRNMPPSWPISEYKDIMTVKSWAEYKRIASTMEPEAGKKYLDDQKAMLARKARDHARTPMQWTAEANGGFTAPSVKPWMKVNDDYSTVNVAAQEKDSSSVLAFWRKMLSLRRTDEHFKALLVYGSFELLQPENTEVFAFIRKYEDKQAVVMVNFTKNKVSFTLDLAGPSHADFKLVVSTHELESIDSTLQHTETLKPWEGRLYSN